jgi:hypothetical protein
VAVKKLAKSGKWGTANTWSPEGVPAAEDEIDLKGSSFNLEVGAVTAKCRSLLASTYKGALSIGVGTITVGDGTAPAGNIALELGPEMTFTTEAGSTVNFKATVGTQLAIKTAGKIMPPTKFEGNGSSYKLEDKLKTAPTSLVSHTQGILNTNGQELDIGAFSGTGALTRTLTIENSTIKLRIEAATNPWDLTTTTNLTFNGAGCTIEVLGTTTAAAAVLKFVGGGKTYGTLTFAAAAVGYPALEVTGSNTFTTINDNSAKAPRAASISTTNGSKTIAQVTGEALVIGEEIAGSGIPAGTVLLSNTEMSAAATATGTVTIERFGPGLLFAGGSTQTVTTFTTNGKSGEPARLASGKPGEAAKLKKASGLATFDWTRVRDITAEGGALFYAGANSTNVSGNTGLKFEANPGAPLVLAAASSSSAASAGVRATPKLGLAAAGSSSGASAVFTAKALAVLAAAKASSAASAQPTATPRLPLAAAQASSAAQASVRGTPKLSLTATGQSSASVSVHAPTKLPLAPAASSSSASATLSHPVTVALAAAASQSSASLTLYTPQFIDMSTAGSKSGASMALRTRSEVVLSPAASASSASLALVGRQPVPLAPASVGSAASMQLVTRLRLQLAPASSVSSAQARVYVKKFGRAKTKLSPVVRAETALEPAGGGE